MSMLAFVMVLTFAIVVPPMGIQAKTNKCWYGAYSELSKDAKKAIKFKKGDKVQLKGQFTFTAERQCWDVKEKKINKTFKFAKNARFFVDETAAEKNHFRKISKNKFKEYAHFDVSHSAFKVRNGKIVKGVVSLN